MEFERGSIIMKIEEIYNSADELKKYIRDLKSLHEVANYRCERGYVHHERMNDIKLLNNLIWLDSCGNMMFRIDEKSFMGDTYSPIKLPTENDVCPHCGKGWSLNNLQDLVSKYDYQLESNIFYHKQCNSFNKLEIQKNEFKDLFSKVYDIIKLNFKAIPNQYCSCDVCSPWFIVSTPDGDIKIGWRKRVVLIEWLSNYKRFDEKFIKEDVTKGLKDNERYIHAWSSEKCIEYLNRAKESICV